MLPANITVECGPTDSRAGSGNCPTLLDSWRFDWACAGKRTIPRGWRDDSGVWSGVTQMTPHLLLWQRPGFQHIYEVTHNCLELQL